MFTGLVEGLGRLEDIALENGGRRLTIAWPGLSALEPLELGESVAVSGCCLTVTAAAGETFQVQAGPETLDRTNLGNKSAGDRVNLERALKVGIAWEDILFRAMSTQPPPSATAARRESGSFSPSASTHPGLPYSYPKDRSPLTGSASPWSTSRPTPSRSCSFPTRWP